jgi:hypothetical protein
MLIAGSGLASIGGPCRRSEVAMEQGGDQPGGGAYVHALIEEAAYLQTNDEKPTIIPRPPPDPAQFKCWFCRKPYQQVQTLFGAEYRKGTPTTSPTRH